MLHLVFDPKNLPRNLDPLPHKVVCQWFRKAVRE
jgi:hypothetical protein